MIDDVARVGPTFRFAPSPNGYLHLGHAYSALMNQAMAWQAGGRMLLRLEDIDRARCTAGYAEATVEDLAWLGVTPFGPVLKQSDHLPAYAAALDRLASLGLTYPCFCTRAEIRAATGGRRDWPLDPDGVPLYAGTCKHLTFQDRERRLAGGLPATRRLDTRAALVRCPEPLLWNEYGEGATLQPVTATPALWGDPILARKDVAASYHIAVVVDDARQGVTDVVRGSDLFAATSLHRLLQALLGLPQPRYRHHRLILDEAGRKLSKSRSAPALRALRARGRTPGDVRRTIGMDDRGFRHADPPSRDARAPG